MSAQIEGSELNKQTAEDPHQFLSGAHSLSCWGSLLDFETEDALLSRIRW
jgi:hypothetical protein